MITRFAQVLDSQGRKSKWLAVQLGLTEATIWAWRTGHSKPSKGMRVKVAEVLGVSVDDLWVDEEQTG